MKKYIIRKLKETPQPLLFTFVEDIIYILFFHFFAKKNNKNYVVVFMLAVESNYYSIQTPLIYKSPVEDLNDFHLAKLVVYLVKLFEK